MHPYLIKTCRGISVEDRFFDHIGEKTDRGCIVWNGRRNKKGYGVLDITYGDYNDRPVLTHRISYELFCGRIPDGMKVCHHCDNPPCINPIHFFLGTDTTNQADKHAKGRGAKGESLGRSLLTTIKVIDIRDRFSKGIATRRQLAEEYGVSRSSIEEIINRTSWKHI